MKKETIFKHELNESIQANAAMNCLKNRNNHKQLNETSEIDYAQLADDVCASYRGTLSKLDLKDSINYIVKMVAKKIGKTVDTLTPQELTAIQKAAKHSVWYVSEQEEHPEDADRLQSQLSNAWDEGIDDDVFDPYDNKFDETHDDIVWKLISAVWHYFDNEPDVEGFNIYECTENQIGKAIEQILDKYGDFPASNNFDKCYDWVKKHAEEIIKVLETDSLENTYEGHPEFDFSEQEELPQMERRDMILALSEYMSESWIDTGDDGDLDDIYYAIADILDATGDYPASTSWEDCKPWCQKHYKEVEAKIY